MLLAKLNFATLDHIIAFLIGLWLTQNQKTWSAGLLVPDPQKLICLCLELNLHLIFHVAIQRTQASAFQSFGKWWFCCFCSSLKVLVLLENAAVQRGRGAEGILSKLAQLSDLQVRHTLGSLTPSASRREMQLTGKCVAVVVPVDLGFQSWLCH